MRFVFTTVLVLVFLSVNFGAQAPTDAPAEIEKLPTLSKEETDDLTILVLSAENTTFRIALLQRQLADERTKLSTRLQSLQKPGYTLNRTSEGNWVYTPLED